jgi:hypothetical protein
MALVWSTVAVEETIEKIRYMPGDRIDMSCFHDRKTNLKAANVTFQLTPEEEDEYIRCSNDVVYFVSKYCKFLTDRGLDVVKLRKFQKEILAKLGEEKWIEEI